MNRGTLNGSTRLNGRTLNRLRTRLNGGPGRILNGRTRLSGWTRLNRWTLNADGSLRILNGSILNGLNGSILNGSTLLGQDRRPLRSSTSRRGTTSCVHRVQLLQGARPGRRGPGYRGWLNGGRPGEGVQCLARGTLLGLGGHPLRSASHGSVHRVQILRHHDARPGLRGHCGWLNGGRPGEAVRIDGRTLVGRDGHPLRATARDHRAAASVHHAHGLCGARPGRRRHHRGWLDAGKPGEVVRMDERTLLGLDRCPLRSTPHSGICSVHHARGLRAARPSRHRRRRGWVNGGRLGRTLNGRTVVHGLRGARRRRRHRG